MPADLPGWPVPNPHVELPEGYSLREDCSLVYVVHGGRVVRMMDWRVATPEILRAAIDAHRLEEGTA